jgi:hypothetical protein
LKKLTIEEMHELVKNRNGKCLSKVYINANTKLTWKCEKGHEWNATPGHVRSGKWCPVCAGIIPSTIEEMKDIALERGGKCLSEEYINAHIPLRWRCSEGHEWEATSNNIKKGTWCPICARMKRKRKTPNTLENNVTD